MSELGLIAIWPNHLQHAESILVELKERFTIVNIYDIQWDKKMLYQNFYRFYGDRLSTKSIKEKTIDDSKFRLIVFEDNSPKHAFRPTARGIEEVNTNFFDLKKHFRNVFNTRFGIHGSNDEVETSRDLSLLLGVNVQDYKSNLKNVWSGKITKIDRDVTGVNGWSSLEQFFYFMNDIEPYILLTNFNNFIPNLPAGDDIDIMTVNQKKFALFANATKISKGSERVNYQITVDNKLIDIDIRYVGDGYFDIHWQKQCMQSRVMHTKGFYVMNEINQYYTMLYHSLIHKKNIPGKYQVFFALEAKYLKVKLYEYMHENSYHMTEPKDITVYFNKSNGGDIKFSRPRRLRDKKGIIGSIKKALNRLNNAIHFRHGPA